LNNPLIFTDPSGEKWWHWVLGLVADSMLGGAISISIATTHASMLATTSTMAGSAITFDHTVTYFGSIFRKDGCAWGGKRSNNSTKLLAGMFKTDENSDGWANFGMLASWTREMPQYLAGLGLSHIKNSFGKVDRIDYLGGATFVTNENASKGNGVSLGGYININNRSRITGDFKDYVLNNPLYMHEYGHTIDSRKFGISYLLAIGLPSLISAGTSKDLDVPPYSTHSRSWSEIRANKLAKDYFGNHYGVDWNKPYRHYVYRIGIDENGVEYNYRYDYTIQLIN